MVAFRRAPCRQLGEDVRVKPGLRAHWQPQHDGLQHVYEIVIVGRGHGSLSAFVFASKRYTISSTSG